MRNLADACLRLNVNRGIFITTSDFTQAALKEQNARRLKIEFWNGMDLINKIKQIPLSNLDLEKLRKIDKIERISKTSV